MKKLLSLFIALPLVAILMFSPLVFADTGDIVVEGKPVTGKIEVGGGTLELPNSDTLPGTCMIGDTYVLTSTFSGQQCYVCESTDVWVSQGSFYSAAYYPDYNEADQGATGNGKSAKAYTDTIGSDSGTILFRHNSGAATTIYQLSTDETIPFNINTIIEKGAILNTDLSIRNATYKWTQTDNYTLAYTSGGVHEIIVTDTLTGAISGATGIVTAITLTSGTWGGGDAAGVISLKTQTGNFEAENLNEGANNNVCTVASDSTQLSEYYLELAAGGDTGISTPSHCAEDGSALTETTAGGLAVSEWDWADNDTLGYSTVYVRLSDSADPDAKAVDYVEAGYTLTINGSFDARLYQVFNGAGSVSFGYNSVQQVFPQWWGAVGDGVTDDVDAIQSAIDSVETLSTYATQALGGTRGLTTPVFFPPGIYITSSELTTSASYQVLVGNNVIFKADPGGFVGDYAINSTATSGWRQEVRGLQFQDYPGGLHFDASNTNSGQVKIIECKFFHILGDAINLETKSGNTIIENCMWRSNKHDINNVDGDYVNVRGGWIQRDGQYLTANYDGAIINHGHMYISDVEGVPGTAETITEPAWVANYGSVIINNCRFGGEPGQMTTVNNFAAADLVSPYLPIGVTITNCPLYTGTQPAVRLFELPNIISFKNNTGLAGTGATYTDWSGSIDGAAQAAILTINYAKLIRIGIEIFGEPNHSSLVPDNLMQFVRSGTQGLLRSNVTAKPPKQIWSRHDTNAIASESVYGIDEYIGYDASAGADGIRASNRVEATGTLGNTQQVFANSAGGAGEANVDRVKITNTGIEPATDNTYYLGKNDDDTPFAWKGVILKDTTNGKYYRIEVVNGAITVFDLTD